MGNLYYCHKCGEDKEESFYHNKGFAIWCKKCFREHKRKKSMEKRSNKESREKEYAKVNIWRMNHPDYKNVNSKQAVDKWRKKVPEASRAYNKIRYAINTGKLIKPNKCEKCGEEKKVAAHHNDYTKPYDIMWLCSKCHKKLHYKYTD